MRIFCAIEYEPFPGNRLWHNNLVAALRDSGHEVVLFDFDIDAFYRRADFRKPANRTWIARHRPRLEAALLAQMEAAHHRSRVDVFFSYFYSAHCRPETIRRIRQMGIKTMNWYCNASYQLELVAALAPAYDLCLVPERERLADYEALGARPLYCQEAANPAFYQDLQQPRDLGIVFIGAKYADRPLYCHALYEAGLPVDAWGAGWSRRGPGGSVKNLLRTVKRLWERCAGVPLLPARYSHAFCADEEMIAIYNRAKIALGFSVVSSRDYRKRPIHQVRLRDFEAPMCGTFYLTEHQEELREFFEIGREIETFRDPPELVDKARFYLAHDDAREKIRRAGYERARRDHTWQKRLAGALEALR